MAISKHFATQVLSEKAGTPALNKQLLREVKDLMDLDGAGRAWSKENYLNGFTSYASANELQKFSPTFQKLESLIDVRVKKFSKSLRFELGGARLKMTTCWVNVMNANTHHSLHLHPLSVISGTYYVSVPAGAPAIKFEDPRASRFMNSPPRKNTHLQVPAKPGSLVLFESWLRHEVPLHSGKSPRVSISFNYEWA